MQGLNASDWNTGVPKVGCTVGFMLPQGSSTCRIQRGYHKEASTECEQFVSCLRIPLILISHSGRS
jgi:hypothetical protein